MGNYITNMEFFIVNNVSPVWHILLSSSWNICLYWRGLKDAYLAQWVSLHILFLFCLFVWLFWFKLLSSGLWDLLNWVVIPDVLLTVFQGGLSFLPATKNSPHLPCVFPAPHLQPAIYPKNASSLYGRTLWDQDLGSGSACYYNEHSCFWALSANRARKYVCV